MHRYAFFNEKFRSPEVRSLEFTCSTTELRERTKLLPTGIEPATWSVEGNLRVGPLGPGDLRMETRLAGVSDCRRGKGDRIEGDHSAE